MSTSRRWKSSFTTARVSEFKSLTDRPPAFHLQDGEECGGVSGDWQPILARIRGLTEAAKLDALLRQGITGPTGSTAYLAQQCREIFELLGVFLDLFRDRLPPASLKVLDDAKRLHQPSIAGAKEVNRGLTGNSLVHLAAIESALTFSLASMEQRVRSLNERGATAP
jgi:hypothetical protein